MFSLTTIIMTNDYALFFPDIRKNYPISFGTHLNQTNIESRLANDSLKLCTQCSTKFSLRTLHSCTFARFGLRVRMLPLVAHVLTLTAHEITFLLGQTEY